MGDNPEIALDDFLAQARAFLDAQALTRRHVGAESGQDHSKAIYRGATLDDARKAADWQRSLFDAGLAWITGPTRWGGRGLPHHYERAYLALEREYHAPSRGPLSISLGMVAPTIEEYGTDHAREQLLRAVRRGDRIGCQLFSEPGAGSDLSSLRTTARRDGDAWILDGQKVWTSGAHYADLGLVLARTSTGPRYRNLTAFIIDMDADGVDVRPLRQMTGGAEFNEVFLLEVRTPDTYRLGEVDDGWSVAMATLMHERNAIGGSSSGGTGLFSVDALLTLLQRLGVVHEPAVADAFARVHAGIIAAKGMRQRAAATATAGQRPGPEMSLSKLALTRNLEALSHCISVALGPRLVAEGDDPELWAWSEFVLGVPGMRIGGGTDEMQRNTIGERVLGLPKEPKITDNEEATKGH